MNRQLPGGQSVFPTQVRPNIFNKLPVEELIDRNGENFAWFRLVPSSDMEEGDLTLPDKDNKGFVVSYEKERKVTDETIQTMTITSNSLQTIYTPISKIDRLYIKKHPVHGGDTDLQVRSFSGNEIRLVDVAGLKSWYQINIDYRVKTFQTIREVKIHEGGRLINFGQYPNLVVRLHWVRLYVETTGRWELIEATGDFTKISLYRIFPKGTKFKIKYDLISPIRMAYKAREIEDTQINEKGPIHTKTGDIEAVTSPHITLTPGDILVNTTATSIEKEIARLGTDGRYRLKISPVKKIESILYNGIELTEDDVVIEDFQYIRLLDPPREKPNYISVIYTYHPSYKVVDSVTVSGQADRLQPRKYLLRPDVTNTILSYIYNIPKTKKA